MVSYEEKKKEALGFTFDDPFSSSLFKVSQPTVEMETGKFVVNSAKSLKQIEEQIRYKISFKLFWDDEYEPDTRAAKKNFTELNKCLLSNDDAQLERLLTKKPAADWLNRVFLEETELDELIGNIKMSSLECQNALAIAIEKEIKRLVNFKTLFEEILEILRGM